MSDKGFKDLLWFMGVVEDNNDPQKLGRAKVRCFGFHTEDKTLLPTEDLPWAYAISGNYSSAITIPELNCWVWGFFLDGKLAQHPMLTGMMMGMPTSLPYPSEGFASADGITNPGETYQPDIPKFARAENIEHTSVAYKNITAPSAQTADGKGMSRPPSPFNASYPHNWVHETKAGHVFEIDSTPNAERINLYHGTSGSYIEMDSCGNMVISSGGSMWLTMDAHGNVLIEGDYNISAKGTINILAENNMNIQVDGNLKTIVGGNYELNVAGYMNTNVGEAIRTRGLSMALESQNNFDIFSGVEMHLGGQIISTKSSGELYLNSAGGNIHVKGGTVYVDTLVEMASGTSVGGLNVNRTELKSSDIPVKKSPIKKNIPESMFFGVGATDDTAEYSA